MMIKKFYLSVFSVLGFAFLSTSCMKVYDKTYSDFDFLQFKFDQNADFSQYSTFSMADTLILVVDTLYNGTNGFPDFNIDMDKSTNGAYSRQIVDLVRSNMLALGLVEVKEADGQVPDLHVSIKSMTVKQVSSYLFYPNYNNYWWGPGVYQPYYTYGVYTYTSNNGSLTIDLMDVLNANQKSDGTTEMASVWFASYEGIVGPTGTDYTSRVLDGIKIIFDNQTAF